MSFVENKVIYLENTIYLKVNMQKGFLFFLFLFISGFGISFAQQTNLESPYACPNFEFTKDMQKGDTDEDVYVLQQILNLDKRTLVAQTGLGSKGKETATFGVGTREALKRFQALFIEYIEVADGKFNTRTRTVMNNVCKGPFFTGEGGNVYDNATNTDKIAPIVGISGPTEIVLAEETSVKIYIGASEAIKTPNLIGLIIDGATAGDVRKTSSTTFSFLVTPNEDVKEKITIQFEADSIEDLAGNKNEIATNEWEVAVIKGTTTQDLSGDLDTSILDDILNSVVSTISTSTDCSTVGSISVYDYSNPCYGKAPMTDPNSASQGGGGGGGGGLQEMLKGLMQGLVQALTGKTPAGGEGSPSGTCMCPPLMGQPTGVLAGKKGPSGGTLLTPCPGAGSYVGHAFPPPPICGQRMVKGKCVNPKADSNGVILTSTVGSCGKDWQWGN
jgi:hypothetical protein